MGDDDGDSGALLRAATGVVMEIRRIRGWLARLIGLLNRKRLEHEFAEELESHLAMHIEDNLRAGMSPEEARRQALIKLGGVTLTQELYSEQGSLPMLETFWQDLRYGARMFRQAFVDRARAGIAGCGAANHYWSRRRHIAQQPG
jgi:hypothetical protein